MDDNFSPDNNQSDIIRRREESSINQKPSSKVGEGTTSGHDSSPAGTTTSAASPTGSDFVLLDHPPKGFHSSSKQRSLDTSFWAENESISKGPGRAVMKLSRTISQPQTAATSTKLSSATGAMSSNSSSSSNNHLNHKRNHSSSSTFEDFTKSCNDDWNSDIIEHHQERPGAFTGITTKLTAVNTSNVTSNSGSMPSLSPTEPLPQPPPTATNASVPGRIVIGPGHPHPPSIFPQSQTSSSSVGNKTSSSANSHQQQPVVVNNTLPIDPKLSKLKKLVLEDEVPDMNQVRTLAWSGIPSEVRPITWKLLLGYVPLIKSKRPSTLEKKRTEYHHLVHSYYNNKSTNDEMWRQIHIDIPRMQPLISIFQQEVVQKIFERILYIWSIRHPASGYVQGMNDLVTPFFVTYLSEFIPGHSLSDVESFEVSSLPDTILRGVEADSFWSFSKLLDSIQDNYTFAQPGIQRLVNLLSRVMSRVDVNLHDHLMRNSVQYLQFSFRWMNNLLIRELPLRCIVRLWDTYLAEGASVSSSTNHWSTSSSTSSSSASSNNQSNDVVSKESSSTASDTSWSASGHGTPFSSSFHLFVCAAFLRFWSKSLLKEQDFQGLMLLLQNLPTFHWTENEIKLMVADAYQLKCTFTPSHLNS